MIRLKYSKKPEKSGGCYNKEVVVTGTECSQKNY